MRTMSVMSDPDSSDSPVMCPHDTLTMVHDHRCEFGASIPEGGALIYGMASISTLTVLQNAMRACWPCSMLYVYSVNPFFLKAYIRIRLLLTKQRSLVESGTSA